jgi:N-dimethylarginine dimethylaminohydrolase
MESIQNEYGGLTSVMLKRPSEAFIDDESIVNQWQVLNYTSKPDLDSAIIEYNELIDLFKRNGTDLHFLGQSESTGLDSIYTRDAAIATNRGMIICNMGKGARNGEPEQQRLALEKAGHNILGVIEPPGTLEGGDVAWVSENVLAVGLGYRTNLDGIRQLKDMISEVAEVVEVHLPHYKGSSDVFHLMSIFSPIDKNLAVVYSPLMPVSFRQYLLSVGYRLIEVPEKEFETMGCNVLALAPGKCLMVEGNAITRERIIEAGAEVQEYKGVHISMKGNGGPTCLTRPLSRLKA